MQIQISLLKASLKSHKKQKECTMEREVRLQNETIEVVPREVGTEFMGVFTDGFRQMLHAKRKADRLSYSELGKLLKVTWLTVRNWEKGKTRKCQPSKILSVRYYLNGRFDSMRKQTVMPVTTIEQQLNDRAFIQRKIEMLDKISKIYEICSQSRELRQQLINEIRRLSREAIASFAEK